MTYKEENGPHLTLQELVDCAHKYNRIVEQIYAPNQQQVRSKFERDNNNNNNINNNNFSMNSNIPLNHNQPSQSRNGQYNNNNTSRFNNNGYNRDTNVPYENRFKNNYNNENRWSNQSSNQQRTAHYKSQNRRIIDGMSPQQMQSPGVQSNIPPMARLNQNNNNSQVPMHPSNKNYGSNDKSPLKPPNNNTTNNDNNQRSSLHSMIVEENEFDDDQLYHLEKRRSVEIKQDEGRLDSNEMPHQSSSY